MNKKYLGLLTFATCAIAIAASSGAIYPSGAGTYNAWTPSSGVTHYTLVDETSCNGTTDYVRTTTVGNRDSFAVALSAVPDGSTITSITVTPCASRNTNKTAVMNVFYRLNGTNSADQGAYNLSGTTPTPLSGTVYSGLSVVKTATTTLEVGAVLTSGTGGARLSNISTTITYTPTLPSAPSSLAVAATSTGLFLTWTDTSNNESRFVIERSTDAVNYSQVSSTTANVTAALDTSAVSGTLYYYRVYATNETGNSANSNVATGTRP
jgi:titin